MRNENNVQKVVEYLKNRRANAEIPHFKHKVVSATMVSEVSGFPLNSIVKTLIVIADKKPYAVMVGGDKKSDYGKLRKLLKCKKVRFAQRSEVKEITGLDVGEVYPLSYTLEKIPKIVDEEIVNKDIVLTGGGSQYTLVKIKAKDLLKVLSPIIANISK